MDLQVFSQFSYEDDGAFEDFLLLNGLSHGTYNGVLEAFGIVPLTYPILDIGDDDVGKKDWLQNHYLMHKFLVTTLNLPDIPDLSDVDFHVPDEFYNWLQLHAQQHQLADLVLNV